MRSICAMKLEEGGDAKAHTNRMQDLFTKLNDIGEAQLSTLWSKIFLLSSLPESYNTLVSALGARNEADITFDVAKQHVIAEYERHANAVGNSGDLVLKIVGRMGACFFCKKTTHQKKDCAKYKEWLAKKGGNTNSSFDSKSTDRVNTIEETEFLFTIGKKLRDGWVIDSGATRHVVSNKSFFEKFDDSYNGTVELADGTLTNTCGIGTGDLTFLDENGHVRKARATGVLYAPKLTGNILSVRRLTNKGFTVEFDDRICQIKYKGKQTGVGDINGNLYVLREPDTVRTILTHNENCIHELHRKWVIEIQRRSDKWNQMV